MDKYQLAGLCHRICWQVPGQGALCVRLSHSDPCKVQDQGLGVSLIEKLWALLCWPAAPTGVHESGLGANQSGQGGSNIGFCMDWVVVLGRLANLIQANLSCIQEPDRNTA